MKRERAEKEISAVRFEYSEAKLRQDTANCVEFSKVVRADYEHYIQERDRWKSDMDSLSRTRAGVAIAQNEDYMRAFGELHQDLEIEADVNKEASLIEYAPKACAEKQPDWGTFESTTQRLESFQSHIQRLLKSFADVRSNIEALGKLALGDLPSSMGEGSRRQQMKDLAESLRVHRRRELRAPVPLLIATLDP